MVVLRQRSVLVEMKSWAGIPSKPQRQVREELGSVGCGWFMARSGRAALIASRRAVSAARGGRFRFDRGKVRSRARSAVCRCILRLRRGKGRRVGDGGSGSGRATTALNEQQAMRWHRPDGLSPQSATVSAQRRCSSSGPTRVGLLRLAEASGRFKLAAPSTHVQCRESGWSATTTANDIQ